MFTAILIFIFIVWTIFVLLFPCLCDLHRWDEPGGHCTDCGECDEFFGKHAHVKTRGVTP